MFVDPNVRHYFSGGLYAKEMTLEANEVVISHRHRYDHLSILANGRVLVEVDGPTFSMESEYTAPACISIPAGHHHRIAAITHATWFCIHATGETDADHIDETLIDEPDLDRVAHLATKEI